jgi:hypothetical protein
MSARCLCFKISVDEFDPESFFKGIEYGCRVDPDKIGFLVIKNFLAIPFSYFNLIYREEFKDNIDSNNFDVDGLNYLI